jgi:hypothetical protein
MMIGIMYLLKEKPVAYIDIDKDIRYYTDSLEGDMDDIEVRVKELEQAVHLISESLNAIEEMLKIIRKEQEDEQDK